MHASFGFLCVSALLIGLGHTATGPDHFLPFIVLSKTRGWSTRKTVWITLICGMAHSLSSILIGLVGIALGISLKSIQHATAVRGDLAAWLLIGCGAVYTVWGIIHGLKHRDHHHVHERTGNLTPLALVLIFVFGPCEPLIPMLMFPAAAIGPAAALTVGILFALASLVAMMSMVLAGVYGLRFTTHKMHRFSHAFAGAVLLLCGMAVQLGL